MPGKLTISNLRVWLLQIQQVFVAAVSILWTDSRTDMVLLLRPTLACHGLLNAHLQHGPGLNCIAQHGFHLIMDCYEPTSVGYQSRR